MVTSWLVGGLVLQSLIWVRAQDSVLPRSRCGLFVLGVPLWLPEQTGSELESPHWLNPLEGPSVRHLQVRRLFSFWSGNQAWAWEGRVSSQEDSPGGLLPLSLGRAAGGHLGAGLPSKWPAAQAGTAAGAWLPNSFILRTSHLSHLCLNLWLMDFNVEWKWKAFPIWSCFGCLNFWKLLIFRRCCLGRSRIWSHLCLSEGDLNARGFDDWRITGSRMTAVTVFVFAMKNESASTLL